MLKRSARTVVKRIERLEKENRFLRIIGGTVLAGLCAIAFLGATSGNVAKKLVVRGVTVVDDEGNMRARLGVDGDSASLALFSGKKPKGTMLYMSEESAGLQISDKNGKAVMNLTVSEEPSAVLVDKNGKMRIVLSLSKLAFLDDKMKERISLGKSTDGWGLRVSEDK